MNYPGLDLAFLQRQRDSLTLLQSVVERSYAFESRDEARAVFTSLAGLFRNLNYSAAGSQQYTRYAAQVEELARAHASDG
jgi:V/A-type H+-transporting ATPase subunit A